MHGCMDGIKSSPERHSIIKLPTYKSKFGNYEIGLLTQKTPSSLIQIRGWTSFWEGSTEPTWVP